ncbi:MAG: 2-dehydropantoate 2-reductase [Anaerolineales bacterium]|nr:2-dehydropantoate 2-reductase [Anaerolineales bacterium]
MAETDRSAKVASRLPDVLVTGTGALASLFAARLSGGGLQVGMLGSWPAGVQALRQDGVCLVNTDGSQSVHPVQVFRNPAACCGVKWALVLVKTWQTARAASQLADCLAEDGLALTLQNGLGNRQILEAALGEERTALGVTTTGATLLAPGKVRDGGVGKVSIEEHPRLHELKDYLHKAGFALEIVPDAQSLIWSKLVINAAINPITALLNIPNGRLLTCPLTRMLMRALARETASVAAAQHIPLSFDNPAAAAEAVAAQTASNHSSMYQDIKRGAPTEIDEICGAIVNAGRKYHIPTPWNWLMWKLIVMKR